MKLEDILRQLPPDQIKWLIARRQLSLVISDHSDLHTVAHYLTRERNFGVAYGGLLREPSLLLLSLARQGGQTSIVGERRRWSPLATEGLVFLLPPEHPQQVIIPDEYLFYMYRLDRGPYACASPTEKCSFIECVQALGDQAIQELAQRLIPQIEVEHPARMAAELKAFFGIPENVDRLLKRISTKGRQLFQYLLECGGRVPLAAVRAHFGDVIGPMFGYYSRKSGEEKLSPLEELEHFGLVFRLGRRDNCVLVVPHEIFDHFLREILAQKEARRRELLKQARQEKVTPEKVVSAADQTEHELLRVLLAVQSYGLRATQRGTPHRQDVHRILRSLPYEDDRRLMFMLALAVQMRLLRMTAEGTRTTDEAKAWFEERDRRKVRVPFNTWLHMELWDETRLQSGFPGQRATQLEHRSLVASFRYLVRDALQELRPQEWVDLNTFLHLCRQDPDYDRMAYLLEAALHLWNRAENTSPFRDSRRTSESEPAYERSADAVIEKTLYSLNYLGLVDLGLDRHQRLVAIRKTDVGEALLRGKSMEAKGPPSRGRELTVQPNLEIIAPKGLPLGIHLALASFADVQTVGHVIVYRLSQQTLTRAIHSNQSLQELRALLAAHSKRPLPQTVESLFASLERREGEIELGSAGGFLRVRDPYLLAELKSRQLLDTVIEQEASETIVLLKPHINLRGLRESLRKKGYFVQLRDGDGV